MQTVPRSPASFLFCQMKLEEIGEVDLDLRLQDLRVACVVVHSFCWGRSCRMTLVENWRDRRSIRVQIVRDAAASRSIK